MLQRRFILLVAGLAACAAVAAEPVPPGAVPVPEPRPDTAPATPPIPQDKPQSGPADDQSPKDKPPKDKPDDGKPAEKSTAPATPGDTKPAPTAAEGPTQPREAPETKDAPSPAQATAEPPEKEDAQAYAACLSRLKDAGVEFSEAKTIDDGNGCGIDKPITVRAVLPGIKLEPEATMRCETAEALSRWTKATVIPSADIAFGPKAPQITRVNQATSYACRNRNNAESGKISEHAHGNAIDIAGFTFSDGKTFTIEPREKDSTLPGAFERAITASACLFFTTVLGPGSDAAHETHLHLDVLKRKGDYRYCW